jgi:hypothetical protein
MNKSKETLNQSKEPAPVIDLESLLRRVEELEVRCTQLETTLKEMVTFETLAERITGKKTTKKRRVKRAWSPEEKAAFHARMVAAREAKARQQAAKSDAKKK